MKLHEIHARHAETDVTDIIDKCSWNISRFLVYLGGESRKVAVEDFDNFDVDWILIL